MRRCSSCGMTYPDGVRRCFVDGMKLEPLQDPRIGSTIGGRFLVDMVLGSGGMARVYGARSRLGDERFAIKVMEPFCARDPVQRERFRREARAAQRLAHPNIIEIHEDGETDDGCPYLVMEELVGETLSDRLDRSPMGVHEALPILVQVARALDRAHSLGVIHRDLKPENIFLTFGDEGDRTVKLLDFGIARSAAESRLTSQGEVFGTPQYMAPERIESRDVGAAVDLYALGCVVYEMLTAERPFDGDDVPAVFVMHLSETPPSLRTREPSVPEELEALYQALMAKSPDDRPVDARSVLQQLEAAALRLDVELPSSKVPDVGPSPRLSLSPVPIDRWQERLVIFDEMLAAAYGAGSVPETVREQVQAVRRQVQAVARLRQEAALYQAELSAAEHRGWEGRQRFGQAVEQLGDDMSRAREEAKEALQALSRARERSAEWERHFREVHKRAMHWEGRSGLRSPLPELAECYRNLAAAIGQWESAAAAVTRRQERLDERRAVVADLDYQIGQLRHALAAHEAQSETEKATSRERMASLGTEADILEQKLLDLASGLCEPLRHRADLGEYFRRLEAVAPSSSMRDGARGAATAPP